MMKRILIMGLAMLILLSGCRQATTVILPPETNGATEETTGPAGMTTVPATDPTDPVPDPTEPATEPTEPPTAIPATEPPTEAPTAPPTQPPTAPPTQPPTAPPTQPPTEPPTEAPTEPDVYDISTHSIGALEWSVLAELNARRTAEGLPELTMDSSLCALAAIRAYECTQNPSHSRPDGRNWSSVLADYGCSGIPIGENILYGSTSYTAAGMVDVWIKSSTHRSLILHGDARETGIGIWYHNGLIYVVTIFAG